MKTMDSYTPVTEAKGTKLGARGVVVLACLILGSIPPGAVYTFGKKHIYYLLICDVICEKVPYGGTNIVRPDQTPRVVRVV